MTERVELKPTLAEQGYRIISRKHRIAARVDRPDWKDHMAERHTPWNKDEGLRWVALMGSAAADFYRRCYSKDRITLPVKFNGVPNSSGDPIAYIDPRRMEQEG